MKASTVETRENDIIAEKICIYKCVKHLFSYTDCVKQIKKIRVT